MKSCKSPVFISVIKLKKVASCIRTPSSERKKEMQVRSVSVILLQVKITQ